MRHLIAKSAIVGAIALMASSASAAITVSQSAYYNYAADLVSFSNANVICDFDSACAAGFSFAFTGGAPPGTGVFNGSAPGITAAPPGDGTDYASVLGPDGAATLTLGSPVNGISFFMGSPDTYNSVSFFSGGSLVQSFLGSAFTSPPANGDQSLGERISFNFNGASIDTVVFNSTQNSFEFDRVGTAVPEPSSWALMIIGFGSAGALLRRRRTAIALSA